jgi:hypothetical protein
MQDAFHTELIRRKFESLVGDLDERARRRWAAVEARALGRGGISIVSRATGLSRVTIRAGLRELEDLDPLPSHCQRRRAVAENRTARPSRGCGMLWMH